MEDNTNVSTQASASETNTATDTGISQSAGNSATIDYEKRFADTQAAYTRSQQELASLKEQLGGTLEYLKEVEPHIDYARRHREFYESQYAPKKPTSAYEYPDGVDGALRERDQELNQIKQELAQFKQTILPQAERATQWQTQQEFKGNQYRLYQEFGQKEFGSPEAFGEFIRALPEFVPNWQQQYSNNPSYETLKGLYWTMRGALEYQPESPLKQQLEAKKQQDFLNKQANYLGRGAIQYGPSTDNPNNPYMSPITPH